MHEDMMFAVGGGPAVWLITLQSIHQLTSSGDADRKTNHLPPTSCALHFPNVRVIKEAAQAKQLSAFPSTMRKGSQLDKCFSRGLRVKQLLLNCDYFGKDKTDLGSPAGASDNNFLTQNFVLSSLHSG